MCIILGLNLKYGRCWSRYWGGVCSHHEIDSFYRVSETDAEIEARIAKWDEYLDGEEEEKKGRSGKNEKRKAQKPGEENSKILDKVKPSKSTENWKKMGTSEKKGRSGNVKVQETIEETEFSSNSDSDEATE